MKKKLLSLALALCLSLAVPALADGHELYVYYANGESAAIVGEGSGEGWSYKDSTLTLSGLTDARVIISALDADPTIVLAPGTKSVLTGLESESLNGKVGYPITFKGTGELILSDSAAENGVFSGDSNSVSLQDGLTMTGGVKEGDSGELTFKKASGDTWPPYTCMAGDKPAAYVRIAPAADAKPAETPAPDAAPAAFTDVAASSPYAEAIKWAVDQKITTGKTATTFGPSDTCTVSHILTFLWRANGKPGAAEGVSDRDSAAKWALEQKLIAENDNLSASCTRSLAVTFMWKVAGSPEADASKLAFTDFAAEDSFAPAIAWAVENKVTSGTTETTFSPENTCTRGQIVTFLFRASK